ncbi:hypothetical protein SAMN05444008_10426 [Cnuella takakiae]|uniref:Uncharacterized protein n=1 Tax=Cnuella takakiae TaxID=1302690 RepID=A0A1M4XSG6_9BACT|nr:hypothetical protein [Cnuella takakiae]OLY92930.1 hypothetical protein BUE76_14310 [Cnuella takakiae]SHE96507.1 hypothetical protein SAMN05444008_10426 [Cnuella takakiae]
MKQINIVPMALIAVLMILAVSCTPLQQTQGGYEEAPGSSRVYRNAPYGNQQVIVVERDPYSGQYFEVSPYGYYGGTPYYGSPRGYNYGYGYPSGGYSRGGNVRGGYNRGGNVGTSRPAPRPSAPSRPSSPTTQRAKDAIRGN